MKAMSALPALAASFALAAGLAFCPPSFAAETGTHATTTQETTSHGVTSGPATGHAVVPNSALNKTSKTNKTVASNGNGVPGATAKKGTEGGPAPSKTMATSHKG